MNSPKTHIRAEVFDRDYFEDGLKKRVSAYENYRWMPERSLREAMSIIKSLKFENVLDLGCAKGFLVKAMRLLGKEAYGVDISEYAISQADEAIKPFLSNSPLSSYQDLEFDLLVSKDTLEHVDKTELREILREARRIAKQVFIVVPLGEDGKYRIREYELDSTHIIRENEDFWISELRFAGFEIADIDYKFEYIKSNWTSSHEFGNLFVVGK